MACNFLGHLKRALEILISVRMSPHFLCPACHLCPSVPVCNFSLSVPVVIYIPCVPVSQCPGLQHTTIYQLCCNFVHDPIPHM